MTINKLCHIIGHDVACVKMVAFVCGSDNFTLLMICLYLCNRSLLEDKYLANCVWALVIGLKMEGVVIDPNVPPSEIDNKCWMVKEKADTTSG